MVLFKGLNINAENIIEQSFAGNSPAKLLRNIGLIVLNDNFKDLQEFAQKFVLKHEEGHLKYDTSNEYIADLHAFTELAGLEYQSLKKMFNTLMENLDLQIEEDKQRIFNIMKFIAAYDASKGNYKLISILKNKEIMNDKILLATANALKKLGLKGDENLQQLSETDRAKLLVLIASEPNFQEYVVQETGKSVNFDGEVNYFNLKDTIKTIAVVGDKVIDKAAGVAGIALTSVSTALGVPIPPGVFSTVIKVANPFNIADKILSKGDKTETTENKGLFGGKIEGLIGELGNKATTSGASGELGAPVTPVTPVTNTTTVTPVTPVTDTTTVIEKKKFLGMPVWLAVTIGIVILAVGITLTVYFVNKGKK